MLSFIIRIASAFEHSHGIRPNLLYLNPAHLERMHQDFPESHDFDTIVRMLQMEMIIDRDIIHPQVAWVSAARTRAV
jgi:hypothetical protein